MKASELNNATRFLIDKYGDQDIMFIGRLKSPIDTLFIEEVTFFKVAKNCPKDGFWLCGTSGTEILQERFIQLNWFGRLIKRAIVKK